MPMSVFISVSKIPFKINHVKVNGNKWPKMRILIRDYSNIRPIKYYKYKYSYT